MKQSKVREGALFEAALAKTLKDSKGCNEARTLIEEEFYRFLSDWSSSSDAGMVAKRKKLRNLQSFYELQEYLDLPLVKGELPSSHAGVLEIVPQSWERRLPSSQIRDRYATCFGYTPRCMVIAWFQNHCGCGSVSPARLLTTAISWGSCTAVWTHGSFCSTAVSLSLII
jgi:hypothetical protein